MKKTRQKYHLAVSYTRYPEIVQLSASKDKENRDAAANIFKSNFQIRLRNLEVEERRNYQVVGYKQIQDIHLRLERKKRLIQSGTKEEKPASPIRSSRIKNTQHYLTKDEVIKFYSPPYATATTSRQQSRADRQGNNSLNASQIMKIKSNKKHSSHQSEQFSLTKLKHRLQRYQQGWCKQVEKKKKLAKTAIKSSQNKIISLIQSVEQYRTISKEKQKIKIEAMPLIWQKVLRSSKQLTSNLQNISNNSANGLKSFGRDKYKKEIQWLQEKDRGGYFFKKDESLLQCPQTT